MSDPYEAFAATPVSPADDAFEITPDDDTDLAVVPKALLIGTAGTLVVIMAGGTAPLPLPVPAGYNPLRVKRVLATDTDAVGIFGLI